MRVERELNCISNVNSTINTVESTFVRVVYRVLASLALPQGHLQCSDGVLMPHVVGDLLSHYLLRIGIRNQEQVAECLLFKQLYIYVMSLTHSWFMPSGKKSLRRSG